MLAVYATGSLSFFIEHLPAHFDESVLSVGLRVAVMSGFDRENHNWSPCMSTTTCELNQEATSVIRRALEKDLNTRGWLTPGYVFFVREVSEPGIELLIENSDTLDVHDAFPVRLQVEWEDINEHAIKNKLIAEVGPEQSRSALADGSRKHKPEMPKPAFSLVNRVRGWF